MSYWYKNRGDTAKLQCAQHTSCHLISKALHQIRAVCKLHKGAEAAREKLHEGAELAKHGTKRSLSAFTERCRKIRHKQDPPR